MMMTVNGTVAILYSLKINGTSVLDVSHSEALDLVRKTKGGKLTLLVQKAALKVLAEIIITRQREWPPNG